jgi:ADP-ribose pyrophosphatase YjhB (NUDIX family)
VGLSVQSAARRHAKGTAARNHATQHLRGAAGCALNSAAMFTPRSIKHCRACGAPTRYAVPADDNRERATCTVCGTIHYENPLNVVGTVPVWGEQVLLCRRNIEPRYGLWTLPAGFMELGETTAEGAVRETVEEAGANIELQDLFTVLNVVRVGQVHLFYLARLRDTRFDPGPETIEAQLFDEATIPWEELAFRTVRKTLECFFADRRRGQFSLHCADIG